MSIIYKVTIEPVEQEAGKEDRFRITWHNVEANTEDFFEKSAREIMQDETWRVWQNPLNQLNIGRKLFRFLDGDSRHLQRALDRASQQGELLHLHLYTCTQAADWPFELLAQEDTFLLPYRLHLVRRVSDWGAARDVTPKNRQLKLLFMACSALDVKPELDFEREEEVIFHITEKLPIDMEVEDSGSLEGLRRRLVLQQYDVVHLSGHANIDEKGQPYFIMEDETGHEHRVFPGDFWNEGLIENPPRLLFLSGCRTGEKPDRGAAVSFARMLVEEYDIPAILGWGRSVSDDQATHAEEMLYYELSRGKTILDAVQRVRYELAKKYQSVDEPAWPLLRLFSSGMPLNPLVQKGQRWQPKPRRMKHVYLKNSQVQVLKEGFVGRRRQLQESIRALIRDIDKVGVLLLGAGGLGKSCLAGKICERFTGHTLIVVQGRLNAITLEAALKDAFILSFDERGQQILSQKQEMTKKLANLCVTSFNEKNYLMLFDGFEKNMEWLEPGRHGTLLPEASDLLKTLFHYLPFSGKMTQLIITGRYPFSLTEQNRDLVEERLESIWLTSFQESEQWKKARELKNILNYPDQSLVPQLLAAGHGNPLLMEWLDLLVGQMKSTDVTQLLMAISNRQEDFIRQYMIRDLLLSGGDELVHFLRWFSIYRRPVLIEGVRQITKKIGLKKWEELVQQGIGLSLIEYDQVLYSYQVTPLLRDELLSGLENHQSCHQAAFLYYKQICKAQDLVDPILIEEWIFHALGCGEEDTASKQGSMLVKHLRERLAFQESRRVGEWVIAEKKCELSTVDDNSLLNELATTISELGDHQNAIKYFLQALSIDRVVYGKEHSNVARDLNNLGSAWDALGDHSNAIEYYQQALDIYRKIQGELYPNVGVLLNNLGSAWEALGDHSNAIEYYQQALDIYREIYGESHPNVSSVLSNIGGAWNSLGELIKAIEYIEQSISIERAVYGESHPNIATQLKNLGSIYRKLGKEEQARSYFEKAYEIFNEFFGPDHPSTKFTAEMLQKKAPKLIKIEIYGESGFLINKEKELSLNVINFSMSPVNKIDIELDSSPQYEIHNKRIKFLIEKLDSKENKVIKTQIRVSEPGKIPLNLKLFDVYYNPIIYIYSYQDNPYIYGPPIENIDNFFGRKEERETITSKIYRETGPHSLVIGEQRSGKTSLLYYFKNSLHNPIFPVYISLEKMPCPEEKNNDEIRAYSWLLDRLIYELKKMELLDEKKDYPTELKYADYFERHISEIIGEIKKYKKGFRLCLLLDEGNRILKIRDDFQSILRATLNELAKDLRLVLACSNEFLDYVQESKSSPLKNVFRYTFLKPFTKEELTELITEPAGRLGYRYEQDALDKLERISGGHPFYCQALCAESFNIARRQRIQNITAKVVSNAKKEIVNKKEVRDKFILGYWNLLKDSDEDKICLKAIIEQKEIDKKFKRTIDKLLNRQLIREIGKNKYSFTSDLFKIWFCELLKIRMIS